MSTIKENFAEMVLLLCGMLGYRRTYINIHMCTVHCTVYACGSGEPVYSNTTIVQYILHLHMYEYTWYIHNIYKVLYDMYLSKNEAENIILSILSTVFHSQ